MYEIHIGSVLSKEPDDDYIQKSYRYREWTINLPDVPEDERVLLVRRTYLTKSEKLRIWMDIFDDVFPDEIIEDAKRIAFDLRFEGHIANCSPSLCAMACLYLSCLFHDHNFNSKMPQLKVKKSEGLAKFGLRPRRYAPSKNIPFSIKKYARIIMDYMPDKFKNLQIMKRKMEGLDD